MLVPVFAIEFFSVVTGLMDYRDATKEGALGGASKAFLIFTTIRSVITRGVFYALLINKVDNDSDMSWVAVFLPLWAPSFLFACMDFCMERSIMISPSMSDDQIEQVIL